MSAVASLVRTRQRLGRRPGRSRPHTAHRPRLSAAVAATKAEYFYDCGVIADKDAFVSLASLDTAHAQPGTEVTVRWGERPNSAKPAVEPHEQLEIRATVAPAPYVDFARERYRS